LERPRRTRQNKIRQTLSIPRRKKKKQKKRGKEDKRDELMDEIETVLKKKNARDQKLKNGNKKKGPTRP